MGEEWEKRPSRSQRQRRADGERRKARRLRAYVAKRDHERCRRCGSTERLTLDHIRPLSRGGLSTKQNLQLLCFSCNNEKDNGWKSKKAKA